MFPQAATFGCPFVQALGSVYIFSLFKLNFSHSTMGFITVNHQPPNKQIQDRYNRYIFHFLYLTINIYPGTYFNTYLPLLS